MAPFRRAARGSFAARSLRYLASRGTLFEQGPARLRVVGHWVISRRARHGYHSSREVVPSLRGCFRRYLLTRAPVPPSLVGTPRRSCPAIPVARRGP